MPGTAAKFILKLKMQYKSGITMLVCLMLAACGGGGGHTNTPPAFGQASYSFDVTEETTFDGSVSVTDADGDEVSITVASGASQGTLQLNADGSFAYIPDQDATGTDTATVRASDGQNTVTAELTFTIANTNDVPVLVTTQITAAAGMQAQGSLVFSDADGDDVTIELVQDVMDGVLSLNLVTGEFTYTSTDATAEVNDSFTISFTDGNIDMPIEAVIAVVPSYSTNADKSSYYFASDLSHLARAKGALDMITDEALADVISGFLAGGYYSGGLKDVGAEFLDEINAVDLRALATKDAARLLDGQGNFGQANLLRTQAVALYNQYLAEKGIDNIDRDDASFYQNVVRHFREAGSLDEALNLLTTVAIYAQAVREDEYNTQYGRFVTSFSQAAGQAVEEYQADPTMENRELAVSAIDDFARFALQIGYNYDDDYLEPYKWRTKAFYVADVALFYEFIGEIEEAKEALAEAISLYSDVNYDPEYNRPAKPYAANTLDDYDFPLETMAYVFAALYPNLDNVPAELIFQRNPDDSSNGNAAEGIFTVAASTAILVDGATVEEAVADAKTYFTDEEDLFGYWSMLIEYLDPHLVWRVYLAGDVDAATEILALASDLLASPEYAAEENTLRRWLGDQGCARVVELSLLMTGDATDAVAACQSIVDTYFQNDGSQDTDSLIEAREKLMYSYFVNRQQADMFAAASEISNEMSNFIGLLGEPIERIELYLRLSAQLASYQLFAEASTVMGLAEAEINTMLDQAGALSMDDLEDVVSEILDSVVLIADDSGSNNVLEGDLAIYRVLTAVRRSAGSAPDTEIATYTAEFNSAVRSIAASVYGLIGNYSVNEQQGIAEDLISLLLAAGMHEEAAEFINDELINVEADRNELWALVATIYSLINDFPGSSVAIVDTDQDGLPNFFLVTATEDEILESGLTADNDADDDGIDDEIDSKPLQSDF